MVSHALKKWVIVLAFVGINIWLFIIGRNSTGFLNISLMNIIGFDVTIIVSVYLVQSLIDNRRKNEYMVRLLDTVAKDLENSELFCHKVQETAKLKQTYIANRLFHLKNAAPTNVKKDIKYVYDKFEDTRIYFDDHPEALSEDKYYERQRNIILVKISKIQLNLFDFNVKDNVNEK